MNANTATSHYPAAPVTGRRKPHPVRARRQRARRARARHRAVFRARLQYRLLTVSETEHEKHLSRITIVTRGTPMVIEQIKNQLERLVPVHRVVDLTIGGPAIERELAMVKVRGRASTASRCCASPMHSAPASSMPPPRASCSRSPARPKRSRVRRPDAAARPGRGVADAASWPSAAVRRGCNGA